MAAKEIKTAILEALKNNNRTLSIKELRKAIIGKKIFQFHTKKKSQYYLTLLLISGEFKGDIDKVKFMSLLDEMSLGKKISIENDHVTKLSKRGRDEPVGE